MNGGFHQGMGGPNRFQGPHRGHMGGPPRFHSPGPHYPPLGGNGGGNQGRNLQDQQGGYRGPGPAGGGGNLGSKYSDALKHAPVNPASVWGENKSANKRK